MAKQKKRAKKPAGDRSSFLAMLFGLCIGLVVAAGVYVADRWQLPEFSARSPRAPEPVSPAVVEVIEEPVAEQEPHPATRFDFYDMLPKFEVVLPEVEPEASPDREAVSIAEPGSYVLQAGSFSAPADAERMRANLALLGVESRLQRISIDDDVYHRVRIGPTSDLPALNAIRRRLWDAEIEVLLIKVPN